MAIVGGHQRDAGFLGEAHQFAVDALFDLDALILNLQEEVPFPENVAQLVGILPRLVEASLPPRIPSPGRAGRPKVQ